MRRTVFGSITKFCPSFFVGVAFKDAARARISVAPSSVASFAVASGNSVIKWFSTSCDRRRNLELHKECHSDPRCIPLPI